MGNEQLYFPLLFSSRGSADGLEINVTVPAEAIMTRLVWSIAKTEMAKTEAERLSVTPSPLPTFKASCHNCQCQHLGRLKKVTCHIDAPDSGWLFSSLPLVRYML